MTSRKNLRASLSSPNPLRTNIDLSEKDLFLLEYIRDRGVNSAIVINYNKTLRHIRDFTEQLLNDSNKHHINKASLKTSAARQIASNIASMKNKSIRSVFIAVKITINGESRFVRADKIHEIPHPYQFIKNKGMNISIVIARETDNPEKPQEIIPLPFVVGTEWCPTSINNHDPVRNHQHGENVVDLRGYALINSDKGGCTPKYFFAHEKVAHNNISTVQNDKGVYITTAKTQDDKNNSVETRLYKQRGEGKEEVYYIATTCFKEPIRVNDLLNDIRETINKLADLDNTLNNIGSETFIDQIMLSVASSELMKFIIYDYSPSKESVFDLSETDKIKEKTMNLFRENNNRFEYYAGNFSSLFNTDTYKEFMINAIFPSIAPNDITSVSSRYNAYIGKAILLMRMLVWNILTESQILEPTDRNDVSNKMYMTIDQVVRRDITRDNGAMLRNREESPGKIHYNPKTASNKGETNVIETFDMTNMFNSIAQLTSLNTPRSSHSKRMGPRDVNFSQTGYICPSETPSTDKVGLVTHMACTAGFSSYKDLKIVEKVVNTVISKTNTLPRTFTNIFRLDDDIVIGGKRFAKVGGGTTLNTKLLSINSIPYAMITEEQYYEIRKLIKRNTDTMDVVVIKETIKVNKTGKSRTSENNLITLSYNIICDSGRIHRPLYRVDKLIEHKLLEPTNLEKLHRDHHDFEYFIKQGIIEIVFPSEMSNVAVCEKLENLSKQIKEKEQAIAMLPVIEATLLQKKSIYEEEKKKLDQLEESNNQSTANSFTIARLERSLSIIEKEYQNVEIEYSKIKHAANQTYTYCEIDPYVIYGVVSSCAPMFNHNPGNRALHQSAMDKSLLSIISSNQNMITESSAKKLHTTSQAVVTTKTNEFYSRYIKNGENAIMGINIATHNQEDAIVVQESFAKSIVSERISFHEFIIERDEKEGFDNSEIVRDRYIKDPKYHAIDMDTGAPRVKAVLKEGDCIFMKYLIETEKDPETGEEIVKYIPKPSFVQTGKEGYVSKVTLTKTNTGQFVAQVILATMKTIDYGDKISSRYSQKSVVGGIIDDNEMPYVKDPTSPLHETKLNLLFSPMSITSRGTVGLLHEMMLGNLGVATGKAQDATAFTVNRDRMISVNDQLMKLGFKPWCVERVFNPVTNTTMYMMVGVVHIRILKHTAADKQKACGMLNFRSDLMTRQPAKGGPTGGSRLGYMDSNTLFGQNAARLVNLLYKEQSSETIINICEECHHYNDRCNRDPSTALDIEAMDSCTRCGSKSLREASTTYSLVMIHNYLLSVGVKLDLFVT